MEINKPGWLETLWNINPTCAEHAECWLNNLLLDISKFKIENDDDNESKAYNTALEQIKELVCDGNINERENNNCNIPLVIGRSEQLPCGDCENFTEYDNGIKYCSVCGTKLK